MLFLLKYLNLKFSNKFRFVPVSPNIIDMSIYYSITISTPWFIQQTLHSQGFYQYAGSTLDRLESLSNLYICSNDYIDDYQLYENTYVNLTFREFNFLSVRV